MINMGPPNFWGLKKAVPVPSIKMNGWTTWKSPLWKKNVIWTENQSSIFKMWKKKSGNAYRTEHPKFLLASSPPQQIFLPKNVPLGFFSTWIRSFGRPKNFDLVDRFRAPRSRSAWSGVSQQFPRCIFLVHPGRLTWNLQITHVRKENDLSKPPWCSKPRMDWENQQGKQLLRGSGYWM